MALDNYQQFKGNIWNNDWKRYIWLTIWGLLCVFLLQKVGILWDKKESNSQGNNTTEQVIKNASIEDKMLPQNILPIKINTSSAISDTLQSDRKKK